MSNKSSPNKMSISSITTSDSTSSSKNDSPNSKMSVSIKKNNQLDNSLADADNLDGDNVQVADADSNFITKLPGVTIKSYDFFGTYVGLEAAKAAIDQGLIGTIKIS